MGRLRGNNRSMSTLPISCYIRTLNEERRIGEVLDSLAGLVSEVILVDSGSTDRTLEIAEEKGARVISQKWLGNGKQKRIGEDACAHHWVLDLDADEVISSELAEEIRELFREKDTPRESVFGIKVATVSPLDGRVWEFAAADFRDKLYDLREFRAPNSAVWSNLEVPDTLKVVHLNGLIHHYSFPDVESLMFKTNRMSAMRGREKKLKSYWFVVLRLWFGFPFYFLRGLFIRGMWRYGLYCWIVAATVAFSRWLTDVKMYEIHHLKEKDE